METSTLKCFECQKELNKDHNGIDLCDSCKQQLVDLEMRTVRKPKFEKANHIIDNIFLGGENAAINLEYLQQNNITHVLVAAKLCKKHFPEQITYLSFDDLDDDPTDDILQYFEEAIDFIASVKQNVLVHCVSGISRSGSIVIAYLMKQKKMNFIEAFAFIRTKRSVVHPNSGFQSQLKKYQQQLSKST